MNDNMTVTVKAMNTAISHKFERTVTMNYCLKFSRVICEDETFIDYVFKNLTSVQVIELVEYVIKDICSSDYWEISIL